MSLFEHLQLNGISKQEACQLFGKSCKTLERWNDNPPDWAVRIIKLFGKKPPFPDNWHGWYFDNDFIVDPAGNKYHINEVSSIFWNRQLIQSLTGDKMDSTIKISLENSGEEIKSWKIAL